LLKIGGLASGLDVDSIIGAIMEQERRPVVNMEQRRDQYQREKDAWRDVNTRLVNLQGRFDPLLTPGLFNRKAAISSDTAVATVSAGTAAEVGTYTLEVIQLAQAHRVAGQRLEEIDQALGFQGTIVINDVEIEIDAEHSLLDIRDAINASEVEVKASIVDNTLVLEAQKTGVENEMKLSGDILVDLGVLVENGGGQLVIANELQAAQDSIFQLNGLEITRSSNQVTDVMAGLTLNLAAEGKTTIKLAEDREAVIKAFRDFVDQFNSTYGFIAERLGEGGQLQGDGTIIRLQYRLRQELMNPVAIPGDTPYKSLGAIGISISKDGLMTLDEGKLREALEEDPEAVAQLVRSRPDDEEGFAGAIYRTREFLREYTRSGGILAEKQEMYDRQIDSVKKRIEDLERRLEQRELNLERQFTQLETALSRLYSQQDWLSMQLLQLQQYGKK
jgi:flagellar hook-associated protein 2